MANKKYEEETVRIHIIICHNSRQNYFFGSIKIKRVRMVHMNNWPREMAEKKNTLYMLNCYKIVIIEPHEGEANSFVKKKEVQRIAFFRLFPGFTSSCSSFLFTSRTKVTDYYAIVILWKAKKNSDIKYNSVLFHIFHYMNILRHYYNSLTSHALNFPSLSFCAIFFRSSSSALCSISMEVCSPFTPHRNYGFILLLAIMPTKW